MHWRVHTWAAPTGELPRPRPHIEAGEVEGPAFNDRPLTPPPSPSPTDAPPPLANNEQPATMNSFRIKHVVNEVAAIVEQHRALPNFDQHARKTCREVVVLLLDGQAGYHRLNIAVPNYQGLRTNPRRAECAVFHAVYRWNADRALSGEVGFDLNPQELARFVFDIMTDYEVYFQAHRSRMNAYAHHYRDVDAILDANPDVQALGEPWEMAPLPLANGRVGCARCGLSMASMAVLKTHHKATHRKTGGAACYKCPWSRNDRPSDLHDHLRSVHDTYRAGHPQAFSINVNHIRRKTVPLLRRLLAEDRATLASLRGVPPPTATIQDDWKADQLAREIRHQRVQIRQQPGWQAVVDRQRADRIAHQDD
ncbi:hypothetical protein FJTKL_01952 [Diaporthe vaccinii]|uniref:C2H2-type domain-containing protein n=1 Tax=Diaporthe vaccinii TaxID=105482 RepID=A0ABR4DZF7_9PEZI